MKTRIRTEGWPASAYGKGSETFVAVVVIILLSVVTFGTSQLIHSSRFNPDSGSHSQQKYGPHPLKNLDKKQVKDDISMEISPNCTYIPSDFKQMTNSIDRALNFFQQNADKLVLDAAVGTRVVQAQLTLALQQHPRLPRLLQLYMKYLLDKATSVSDQIIRSIKANPEITLREKEHTIPWVTIPGLWNWPERVNEWEPASKMKSYEPFGGINATEFLSKSEETLEEEQSDACIFQIFNCQIETITEECRNLFLTKAQSLLSLTHQVIYTLFARKLKCSGENQEVSLRQFQEQLCGKVWLEANAIALASYPVEHLDLFVEQIGICGMSGYSNFFRRDWLNLILSWQSKRDAQVGCFIDQRFPTTTPIHPVVKPYHQQNKDKFQKVVQPKFSPQKDNNPNNIPANRFNPHSHQQKAQYPQRRVEQLSRQKRSDTFLKIGTDFCSVHFTAVSITALSVQVRHFIDTCFHKY